MPARLCITCGAVVHNASYCTEHQPRRPSGPSGRTGGMGMPGWRWQQIRQAVLARDGGRCQLCGDTATQIDHIVPRAAGGANGMDNLRSLCARCHAIITARQRRLRGWRR